ncbi:monovalent cation/H+ antiporter subunit A [Falsochrobactrum shanghaiense]|uniref:Monovalent cation/H+ antiporter subunit A n=1 Tax=Falsochrobactrum shanghaiense TaxID=2201899 RepID=A0A316JBS3_9HYPH|nr:monovalent cation/H+ antiporter subunit A [Falsochrobactrum shanghaiense]PWL18691.1 monovalent cation/H+ antiporter subunit A [Falsochrobactrum shanghaiense]
MTTDGRMLFLLVLLPFLGSAVTGLFKGVDRTGSAWFTAAIALVAFVITASLYPVVSDGHVLRGTIEWVPAYGLNVTLRMDGFSWLFAMLITGIGLLVVVYARYYMSPEDPVPRFFSFLQAFMGAMLGIVLSGNIILLAVFWELTSIFSFLLIGYWYQNASARDGARMALTVTGIGGFCLLAGVVLLGHIVGSYDLDEVLSSGNLIRAHPLYTVAFILILMAAFTKSAQFPFHFWLPNAMAAPTPVSAYLHSATMVKAGVFLLARLWPVFAGTEEWFWILGIGGLTTLLIASFFAVFQQDLKGLLAYSTISNLGLITALLSLGSPLATVAAIFHMVNHAIFKASLFMAAGIIDHETGTRDMRKLSGLLRAMPYTATLAMVASASMAGVPLLNGFLSKEMFFAEAVETHMASWLDTITPYVATIASAFTVAYSIRFIYSTFFGPPPVDLPKEPHEPPAWMRRPIELLVLLCLLIGVIPGIIIGPFLHSAVMSVLGDATPQYSLAVWHGFNLPLMMSFVAMIGGILLHWMLKKYLATSEDGPPLLRHLQGQRIFERVLVTLSWNWARKAESFLSTRRLQPQLRIVVGVAIVAAAWPILATGIQAGGVPVQPVDPVFAALWVLGGACAIGAAYQAKFHRLAALILLGGAGLVTCLTFVWLSAPDLAVTQLLVEIVTTVLLLLGLRWLPKRWQDPDPAPIKIGPRIRRYRDFMLAIISGVGVFIIAYATMTRSLSDSIGDFFLQNAYSGGGGKNVVNVILVDFRAFDTFGEITVLGIVALTIFALLRRFRPAPDSTGSTEQQKIQDAYDEAMPDRSTGETLMDYLAVPSVIMKWLFPVIIVMAVYLFLRGHDLPGGGFAAGITLAIAFLLQYLASGTRWVEDRLRILPVRWIAMGLLTAAATGAGAWLFGYPFLTSYFQYIDIPHIGKMPAASALLFDLGVFTLVVGATVLILIALAHQSIRKHRVEKIAAAKEEN